MQTIACVQGNCHMIGGLTLELTGTQQTPRSGLLLLRVRVERHVERVRSASSTAISDARSPTVPAAA